MKIMYRLTLIHLKQNKKRTFVTMLGIIISVAMITAVGAGYTSAKHFMQEYEIEKTGRWHISYSGKVSEEPEYSKHVKTQMLAEKMGYADFKESENVDKPYIYLYAYEKKTFEEMSLELSEGRFAKNDSEIVLSQHLMDDGGADYKLGDKITLNMGERTGINENGEKGELPQRLAYQNGKESSSEKETFKLTGESKTYTVVGIIERPDMEEYWAPGYSAFTYLDRTQLTADSDIVDYVYFTPVKASDIDPFRHNPSFKLNHRLLDYCGIAGRDSISYVFLTMGMFLMAIIMAGSISLIYNAFAISSSDRGKEFGMLASVGATTKQKRNAVLFEAAVMSIVSIPVGLLSGLLGIGITFRALGKYFRWAMGVETAMTLAITKEMICVIILASIFTIFISAWIPAMRAARMTVIDAVMKRKEYKYSARSLRTSKLVTKIFGFEGSIALKNLKRNKRQYRSMTFSLMITFVLFTTLTTYTTLITKSYTNAMNMSDYDMELSVWDNIGEANDKEIFDALKQVDGIKGSNWIYRAGTDTTISKEELLKLASDDFKTILFDKEISERYGMDMDSDDFSLSGNVIALDEDQLADYAEKIGMSREQAEKMGINDLILVNQKQTLKKGYYANYSMFDVKEGSRLNLSYEKMKWSPEITKVTDVYPMGTKDTDNPYITYVMSKEGLKQLISKYAEFTNEDITFDTFVNRSYFFQLGDRNPLEIEDDAEQVLKELNIGEDSYYLYNGKESNARNMAMNTIFQVLMDGFVVLISLICVANLCNTISTAFELRRREFAMLKSVGMEQKKFMRMIHYESMFYGLKALLYGIPVSLFIIWLMYRNMSSSFYYTFKAPLMIYGIAILGIAAVISFGMFYATSKIAKENIVDGLRMQ